jgi:hypothetical protein
MSDIVLSNGYILSVNMVRYTIEQHVFCTNRMGNMVSPESMGKNFVINFPGLQFQAEHTFMNLLMKSDLLGHLWTRNPLKPKCA